VVNLERVQEKILDLSQKLGLKVDPKAKVNDLAVGERQRVEIVRALYCGARVLILDEPTSVLTPQEVKELTTTLRRLVKEGLAVVAFITHKLPEVMAMTDRVTVLRRGAVVATVDTRSVDEKRLAKMMVGRETFLDIEKRRMERGRTILEVNNLCAVDEDKISALKNVSFTVSEGEILGIAGVAGNGQRELEEVLIGLRKPTTGSVLVQGKDVGGKPPEKIIGEGVGYIPEDRQKRGVVADASVAENLALKACSSPPLAYRWFLPFDSNWFIDSAAVRDHAEKVIQEYEIKTTGKDALAKTLSGGNLQRLILARELSRKPKLMIASQPTGGLDVGAAEFVRSKLMDSKMTGAAVLLISEDLDEIMTMSDRIAVMYGGEIVNIVSTDEASVESIGFMMAGLKPSSGV
jgi:simple sugar transport system ATP-binding protein